MSLALALPAQAAVRDDDLLIEVVRTTKDLELLHSSLLKLKFYNPVLNLLVLNESTLRLMTDGPNDRLAQDLLTIYTGELGLSEKSRVMTLAQMVHHEDAQVRLAAAIFLRDHFTAHDPSYGFFPSRPRGNEDQVTDWTTGWMYQYTWMMARTLAKMARNGVNDEDELTKSVSKEAYGKITAELMAAARDMNPDPSFSTYATAIKQVRQKLAVHWLDGLSKIALEMGIKPKPEHSTAFKDHTGVDCEGNLITPTFVPPKKTLN